ncbi:MAG: hypothetical protein AB8H86_32470, partial [Polyangiales bacterium]
PTFVTFVHAHVNMDAVLDVLRWDAAYTLACCMPGNQLTNEHVPHSSGDDMCVLSPERHFEVLVNPLSRRLEADNNVCLTPGSSFEVLG